MISSGEIPLIRDSWPRRGWRPTKRSERNARPGAASRSKRCVPPALLRVAAALSVVVLEPNGNESAPAFVL